MIKILARLLPLLLSVINTIIMASTLKRKVFYNMPGDLSGIDVSEDSDECGSMPNESGISGNENLTAEKVFFSGLNKKFPVEEHSTLLKITNLSLVQNSV